MRDIVTKLRDDLRDKLDTLRRIHEQPALYLGDYFFDLRNEIDTKSEEQLAAGKGAYNESETRRKFIDILNEIEAGLMAFQPCDKDADSIEACAALERKLADFEASSVSSDIAELEDIYIHLAVEIVAETNRLERSLFREQTVIYKRPPKEAKQNVGRIYYFGEDYFSPEEVACIKSIDCETKYNSLEDVHIDILSQLNRRLLVPASKPFVLKKNLAIIHNLAKVLPPKTDLLGRFFYFACSFDTYTGYCAANSSIVNEFISYRLPMRGGELDHADGLFPSADLFDCFSSGDDERRLTITDTLLNSIDTQLLATAADSLVELSLIDVRSTFNPAFLESFVNLKELRFVNAFDRGVNFDLEFLASMPRLETLKMTLPDSPVDFGVFSKLAWLTQLRLEGPCCLQRKPISQTAIKQLSAAARLQSLTLFYLDIEAVEQSTLSDFQPLRFIRLEHNRIGRIESDAFKSLRLCGFTMEDNEIVNTDWNDGVNASSLSLWECIASLEILTLKGNGICELPCGCFARLTVLENLDLSGNMIKKLRKGSLASLPGLRTLILDDNPIDMVEAGSFSDLTKLVRLSMVGCRLKSIDNETFAGLKGLESLVLKDNQIQSIQVINETGRLVVSVADMTLNELAEVRRHLFTDLQRLTKFDLSGNRLVYLDLNCFVNLQSLEELNLASNRIVALNRVAGLQLLFNLRSLDLSQNQLNVFKKHSVSFCSRLTRLDLSSNRLQQLEFDLLIAFPQLSKLNLARNSIFTGLKFDPRQRTGLQELDLTWNPCVIPDNRYKQDKPVPMTLKLDAAANFQVKPRVERLELCQSTPDVVWAYFNIPKGPASFSGLRYLALRCCSIRTLTRGAAFKPGHFSLALFKDVRLVELDLGLNLIEALDEPNLFAELAGLQTLNLSCNRIGLLNRRVLGGLHELKQLDMTRNQLKKFESIHFGCLPRLEELMLGSNQLVRLDLARLAGSCRRLERLDLSDNRLDHRSVNAASMADFSRLKRLNLAGNLLEFFEFDAGLWCLAELDLSTNLICSVDWEAVEEMASLIDLDLSSNRISAPTDEALYERLATRMKRLELAGNLFDETDTVDCSFIELDFDSQSELTLINDSQTTVIDFNETTLNQTLINQTLIESF